MILFYHPGDQVRSEAASQDEGLIGEIKDEESWKSVGRRAQSSARNKMKLSTGSLLSIT